MRRSRKCSRTRRRRCVCPALLPSVRAYALASCRWRSKAQGEQPLLFPFSSSVCRQHAVASLFSTSFPSRAMLSPWPCQDTLPTAAGRAGAAIACVGSLGCCPRLSRLGLVLARFLPAGCGGCWLLLRDVPMGFSVGSHSRSDAGSPGESGGGQLKNCLFCGPREGSDYCWWWSGGACPTCSS